MTAAEQIAEFSVSLDLDAVPPSVVENAKLHLLDVIGCGLAASGIGEATAARAVLERDGGRPEATVIGGSDRLPAPAAAFANAVLCHALDFDDTHADAIAHVSVTAGPAALAEAEATGASGRELLAAFIAGSETTARIGMAAPGAFHAHGLHPTAVCGVFGAAAAAARLHRLDAARTTSALGLAGSMSSGLLAFLDDGTPTKPVHAGVAAHGGVLSARLAEAGAEGPASVLEGRFGLFRAFLAEDIDIAAQVADLGERWETERSAYKAYPACHIMHGALGAAELLLPQVTAAGIDAVEEIVAIVPPGAVPMILEPVESKLAPRSDYEGKFSLQYSVAAMLIHGRVNLRTYQDDSLADERVLALARRVTYETAEFPTASRAFPGGLRIRLADGTTLEEVLPYQRGAPESPLTPAQVQEKFRDNASFERDAASALELERLICSIEDVPDVRAVLGQLTTKG